MFIAKGNKYQVVWSCRAFSTRGRCVIQSQNRDYELIDTQVALLAIALGGVYSRKSKGYRISETMARRFHDLQENGWKADFNKALHPPASTNEKACQLEFAI